MTSRRIAWANLQKITEDKERTLSAAECLAKVNKALKELRRIRAEGESAAMDMSPVDVLAEAGESIKRRVQRDFLGLDKD